ncbi:uncharacterized protein N7483_004096 [Penicillium malachiteum]|uniref:uncharacterized protein n=1 Tax=Penicillium malachiteum TaxID=1324776 RepID=UPI00254902E6|nr:uncharacterized protein N7483_004096 [Penicillium malachiteum]KAJ5729588.1 hypothetical protein N7483_004096 [Penicillium malachiteum]
MIPIPKQPNEAPITFNDERTIITEGNEISRCNLSNCNISNSRLKRSTFKNCALSHVRSARWTEASDSRLQNVDSVKRSQISAKLDAKSQLPVDGPEDYALDSDPSDTDDSEDEKDLPPPYKP